MTALTIPPRFPAVLPRGPELWDAAMSGWSKETTSGLFANKLIESYLRLTKGPQRGELVRLRMWQGDLVCDVLRRDPVTRKRLHRTYLAMLPRKNSKSLIGSGLALDGLVDEPGAEVYSCAADKDQAKIVFKEVKDAIEMSADLDAKQGGIFRVYKDAIEYPAMGSVYRALSAEAFTKEGLNPSRVIFDELHAQPSWELWNVMNQGNDARTQPLVVAITTFGVRVWPTGEDTVCYKQYQYVKKIMAGEVVDDSYGGRIYETDNTLDGFDYLDESHWHAANPALGDFLLLDNMRSTSRKMPEADFLTKRLNVWVMNAKAWLPSTSWAECKVTDREVVHEGEHAPSYIEDGAEVVLGFDGAFNNDSTALLVVEVGDFLELPDDDEPDRDALIEELLEGAKLPHVEVVEMWERKDSDDPNWRVPIREVENKIRSACKLWNVREIVCDPARWARTYQKLEEEGLPVVEYPQTPVRMVPATQRFYEAVVNRTITHNGDPRLTRHLENAVTRDSGRGSMIYKETKSSQRKIDGAVATIIAVDRAAGQKPENDDYFFGWDDL